MGSASGHKIEKGSKDYFILSWYFRVEHSLLESELKRPPSDVAFLSGLVWRWHATCKLDGDFREF